MDSEYHPEMRDMIVKIAHQLRLPLSQMQYVSNLIETRINENSCNCLDKSELNKLDSAISALVEVIEEIYKIVGEDV
jgi:hypothetical protein